MAKRIFLTSQGPGGYLVRSEPESRGDPIVSVRAAEGPIPFDGVWVNGARSYDTYVVIDGFVAYHAPRRGLAERSFDWHEQAGGGHRP